MDFLDDTTRVNKIDFDDDFAAGFYNTEPDESEPPSEPLLLAEPSDDDEVVEVPKSTGSEVKKRLSSPEIAPPTKRRRLGKNVIHFTTHVTEDKWTKIQVFHRKLLTTILESFWSTAHSVSFQARTLS
jgi:hypothetical protein